MKECIDCGAELGDVHHSQLRCDVCRKLAKAAQDREKCARERRRNEYLRVKDGGKPRHNLKGTCKTCGEKLPEGSRITRWYCETHQKARRRARVERWKARQRKEREKLNERRR